jgi:ketosteroid isomerase-like protein
MVPVLAAFHHQPITNQLIYYSQPIYTPMKTLFLSLALTATALLPFSQPAFAQKGDDVAQIKAVVERETTAWNTRDVAAFVDCWANVPEAGQLVTLQDATHTVVSNHNTKQDMPTGVKTMLAAQGKDNGETFQNTDYLIRQKGDAAFVQFEQTVTAPDGQKQYAHETRYLEKISGKWKIVHVGAAFYTPAK